MLWRERCFEEGRSVIDCSRGALVVLQGIETLIVSTEGRPYLLPEAKVFLRHIVNVGVCTVSQQ